MSKIARLTCFLPWSCPCQLLPVAQTLALGLCGLRPPVPLPSTLTPRSRGLPSLPAPCLPPGSCSASPRERVSQKPGTSLFSHMCTYRDQMALSNAYCTAGTNYIPVFEHHLPYFYFFAQASEQFPTHLTQFCKVSGDRR